MVRVKHAKADRDGTYNVVRFQLATIKRSKNGIIKGIYNEIHYTLSDLKQVVNIEEALKVVTVRMRSGSRRCRIEIGAKVSFPAAGGSPCKMAESRMTRSNYYINMDQTSYLNFT